VEVLHEGYWLGKSVTYINKDKVRDLERYFHIADFGHDVSVISEPDIHFCFFYYDQPFDSLLHTTIKLCQNLDKHIILICDDEPPEDIANLEVVVSVFSIKNDHIRLSCRC